MKTREEEDRRQATIGGTTPTSTRVPSDDASLKRANNAQFQNATDDVASPSAEASHDPAATRHEPMTDNDRVLEKGKYEAAVPFRPPPGNRL
jgi:hypothetical protein